MSTTVNNAFDEFMRDKVNLDSEQTNKAKSSRDNLIENINNFSGDFDFFAVYSEKILKYGSFERKTKIRPVDDIDLMFCLSGEGTRTYTETATTIYINGSLKDSDNNLLTQGTKFLNSTKVINRFITKISELKDYSMAEMHKNQEAATLQLRSYPWNFDIVPSFYTDTEVYLIPDGSGNWKKTNPRIDNSRIILTNQRYKGNLLNLIRLFKYWNNRKVTLKIGSYLLECMILNQYLDLSVPGNWWIDMQFSNSLMYVSEAILHDVADPKGFQGNLNSFNYYDRQKISTALANAYYKTKEAFNLETTNSDQKGAINKWREVFGVEFPLFSET